MPTVYPGTPEATNFGESDTGSVAIAFFPLDRARRPIVRREQVGSWQWGESVCQSMSDLRILAGESDLRKTVLRLKLDMWVPMSEYDEAERILTEMRGSLAANPRVGVLAEDRGGLRLATDAPMDFGSQLQPILQSTITRLQANVEADSEIVERALHHLYRLVRESEA